MRVTTRQEEFQIESNKYVRHLKNKNGPESLGAWEKPAEYT